MKVIIKNISAKFMPNFFAKSTHKVGEKKASIILDFQTT